MKPTYSWGIWAGLAFLYVAWGSTYLAIRYVVEVVPPLLAAGVRNFLAGAILLVFALLQPRKQPLTARAVGISVLVGGLLLTVGNGGVTLAAGWVPSGYASLFPALVPTWLVLLEWAVNGRRPGPQTLAGVALGLLGVGLLISMDELTLTGKEAYFGWGVLALLVGSVGWAVGVIVGNRAALPYPAVYLSGLQMVGGGGLLLGMSGLLEPWHVPAAAVLTPHIGGAFVYLLLVGSLMGFTVFSWLSQRAPATLVATYSYVNPMVAIFLGWALAGEKLNGRMLLATGLVVAAVVLITNGQLARASSRTS